MLVKNIEEKERLEAEILEYKTNMREYEDEISKINETLRGGRGGGGGGTSGFRKKMKWLHERKQTLETKIAALINCIAAMHNDIAAVRHDIAAVRQSLNFCHERLGHQGEL
jgi:uncharacterized coiled-coil DUF342 family protein